MPFPKTLVHLLIFIDHIYFGFQVVFFYLGLLPQMPLTPWADEFYFPFMVVDEDSPAMVKRRLPVLDYRTLLDQSQGSGGSREATCVVCLMEIEARDKVRELGNCRHAIHKSCIDMWIDAGQLNCPLCRSKLLCSHGKKERGMVHDFLGKLSRCRW